MADRLITPQPGYIHLHDRDNLTLWRETPQWVHESSRLRYYHAMAEAHVAHFVRAQKCIENRGADAVRKGISQWMR